MRTRITHLTRFGVKKERGEVFLVLILILEINVVEEFPSILNKFAEFFS